MKTTVEFTVAIAMVAIALTLIRPRVARAELLKAGQQAPGFKSEMVVGDKTQPVSLADYRGRMLVLYFYPKDETPGCTKEACAFRDAFTKYEKAGIAVLGCSVDTADSHKAFIARYHLPFALLLDPHKKIAREYGAINGIPLLGLDRRITYVIGKDGRILKVYPKVDPALHADQILHDLKSAQASPSG